MRYLTFEGIVNHSYSRPKPPFNASWSLPCSTLEEQKDSQSRLFAKSKIILQMNYPWARDSFIIKRGLKSKHKKYKRKAYKKEKKIQSQVDTMLLYFWTLGYLFLRFNSNLVFSCLNLPFGFWMMTVQFLSALITKTTPPPRSCLTKPWLKFAIIFICLYLPIYLSNFASFINNTQLTKDCKSQVPHMLFPSKTRCSLMPEILFKWDTVERVSLSLSLIFGFFVICGTHFLVCWFKGPWMFPFC